MYLVRIVLVTAILLFACEKKPGQEEYITIEKLPQNERLKKFSSYPIEKQIDIYLFTHYLEGGSGTYEGYLASDGENKLFAISRRIDENIEPMMKVRLISAIELIGMNCDCVSDNSEVIKILEDNKMPIDDEDSGGTIGVKNAYNDYLQRIKSQK